MQFTGPEKDPSSRLISKVSSKVPSNSTYFSPVELLEAPGRAISGFVGPSVDELRPSAGDKACGMVSPNRVPGVPVCASTGMGRGPDARGVGTTGDRLL